MSTTRRAFLHSAVLGAWALPGWAAPGWASRGVRPGPRPAGVLPLHQVIFDARRAHALAFAETAARLGANTRAIRGNVCATWFEDLCGRWRAGRTPIAGMTDFRSLLLLQTMVAEAGLHPILRIHHRAAGVAAAGVPTPGVPTPGVPTPHQAFGIGAYRAIAAARLANCGEAWVSEVARLVVSLPKRDLTSARHADGLLEANLHALGSQELVTWVMA